MMRRNFLRWGICSALALVVLLGADVALACPTCRDGLAATDPHYANVARGYFYSILFMLAMPFTLISCFGLYMYREVRKARARDAAKAAESAAQSTVAAPSLGARQVVPS
jgi:hypothetical protein